MFVWFHRCFLGYLTFLFPNFKIGYNLSYFILISRRFSLIEKSRSLGMVKLVQIQPKGMRITTPEGRLYDPTRRETVGKIEITSDGIAAEMPGGEQLLDIHHRAHPDTHYKPGNSVSIGFTAHYRAMRSSFGPHIVDGSAGENVIIEFSEEIWLADLGKQLLFENPWSGQTALLDVNRFAAPCESFTHFIANCQHTRLPAEQLKTALKFLGNGRRGFLLSLAPTQESAFIQPGDRVFAAG